MDIYDIGMNYYILSYGSLYRDWCICHNLWEECYNIPNVYIRIRISNKSTYFNGSPYTAYYNYNYNYSAISREKDEGIYIKHGSKLYNVVNDMINNGDTKQAMLHCKHESGVIRYISKYILDGKWVL